MNSPDLFEAIFPIVFTMAPPVCPPLSPREQQVLALVKGGQTRKEVAYDLGLSHSTVRVLFARAMRKMGRPKRDRSLVGSPSLDVRNSSR